MSASKAVLVWYQDPMTHYATYQYVLQKLAADTCEGDGAIIASEVMLSLFVNRLDVG